jgi:hypothetical protein
MAKIEVQCKNCEKKFEKERGQANRSENHFCSRSCSVSYHNTSKPKRQSTYFCETCGNKAKTGRLRCDTCLNQKKIAMANQTLGDLISRCDKRATAYSAIRTAARLVAKKEGWCKCANCPYDKHIEIAHRKPIGSFPLETMITEINAVSNLLPLCPNCHWEFDYSHTIMSTVSDIIISQ